MTCSLVLQKKKSLRQNLQHGCNTFNQSSLNLQVKKKEKWKQKKEYQIMQTPDVLAENGGNTTGSGLKIAK